MGAARSAVVGVVSRSALTAIHHGLERQYESMLRVRERLELILPLTLALISSFIRRFTLCGGRANSLSFRRFGLSYSNTCRVHLTRESTQGHHLEASVLRRSL